MPMDGDDDVSEYVLKNKKKVMKKDGLRRILPEVDDAFFACTYMPNTVQLSMRLNGVQ